jgi:hypothetical protein
MEAKKSKKGATIKTKKKKSNGNAATNKGKRKVQVQHQHLPLQKKCKKTSATTSSLAPSTPSKCLPAAVPHDTLAMGIRSKKRERSINDLLAA